MGRAFLAWSLSGLLLGALVFVRPVSGMSLAWAVTAAGFAQFLWLMVSCWQAGMALSLGAQWVSPMLAVRLMPTYVEWAGIGFIVPGLLAHQFDRQGVLPTLAMLASPGSATH